MKPTTPAPLLIVLASFDPNGNGKTIMTLPIPKSFMTKLRPFTESSGHSQSPRTATSDSSVNPAFP